MEKVINIDGKNIPFKSTAAMPLRYKQQFQRDFFADIMKMGDAIKGLNSAVKGKDLDFEMLDSDVLYNLIWVLAKTADKDVASPIDWLDSFETFPLNDIYPQIQDLLLNSISGMNSKTPKKPKATSSK